ncbi:hypothetical protein [Streptomyces tardus]|uniref:hypothetical protein n=1 Tax=Streptomyces tardus TaxID=2780544 RepID=UPI0035560AD6
MERAAGAGLEAGPAFFAGTVCVLFGALLLVWTVARMRRGEPVVAEGSPVVAALLTVTFGAFFLAGGLWLLLNL